MPKRIDATWDRLILQVRADNPTWGATKIRNAIIPWGEKQGLTEDSAPSPKTVENRIKSKIDDEKLDSIQRVYFPESFGDGLPWEAAPYVIEFINMYPHMQVGGKWAAGLIDGYDRPTIRAAKHYYHLALATAEKNDNITWGFIRTRCMMAMQLAFADVTPNPVIATRTRRLVEGWVRYEPWMKLRNDGGNAIQRFMDYEKYVDWVETSYPNTGAETQEPTRDVELIELGFRPDQWPDYQKQLMEGLNKMIQEENNAKER